MNAANCPSPGTAFPPRTTRWFELELITWGDGVIVTDGERFDARKGKLLFRPPGVRNQGIAPYYCYLVVFDISYNPSKKQSYHFPPHHPLTLFNNETLTTEDQWYNYFPKQLDVRDNPEWEILFKSLFEEFIQSKNQNQFTYKTLIMQLLHKLYKTREDEGLAGRHHSLQRHLKGILTAKAHIDNHPASSFILEQLAALAGLSKNFFCTTFKEIVGESPIVYANRVKISTAKTMLIQTNDSVKQISNTIGFDNVTYFHRLFKSLEGITPQQYRDRAKMQF